MSLQQQRQPAGGRSGGRWHRLLAHAVFRAGFCNLGRRGVVFASQDGGQYVSSVVLRRYLHCWSSVVHNVIEENFDTLNSDQQCCAPHLCAVCSSRHMPGACRRRPKSTQQCQVNSKSGRYFAGDTFGRSFLRCSDVRVEYGML